MKAITKGRMPAIYAQSVYDESGRVTLTAQCCTNTDAEESAPGIHHFQGTQRCLSHVRSSKLGPGRRGNEGGHRAGWSYYVSRRRSAGGGLVALSAYIVKGES